MKNHGSHVLAVGGCLMGMVLMGLPATQALAQEASTTTGKVAVAGDKLTVKPENGDEMTFCVRILITGGKSIREEKTDVALKKGIFKGLPITVKWSVGEGGRKYIDQLTASGNVVGTVVTPREKGFLTLKVEGMDEPMRLAVRSVDVSGKQPPSAQDLKLIEPFKIGAKVQASYSLDGYLRIGSVTAAK